MKDILILEDDASFRSSLAQEFLDKGFRVHEIDVIKNIPAIKYDYAVVDLQLKNERGIEAISLLLELNPECRIVLLTGYGSIASSVEAIRLGAINYLTKPVDIAELERVLFEGIEQGERSDKSMNRQSLSEHEYEYIQYVLNQNGGNITKTAKELGMYRQSLQRKLKKSP
nr:response regulator [Bacteriovorax sp. HI3]